MTKKVGPTAEFQNVSENCSTEILNDWNLVTCAQGTYPFEFHAH